MKSLVAALILSLPAAAFAHPANRPMLRPHRSPPHMGGVAGGGGHGSDDAARPDDNAKRSKADKAQSGVIGR